MIDLDKDLGSLLCIIETGKDDDSPLWMISEKKLEYYKAVDAELKALKARDAKPDVVGSAGFEPATYAV